MMLNMFFLNFFATHKSSLVKPEEISGLFPKHFLSFLFSCSYFVSSLFILDTSPLSDIWFPNIFVYDLWFISLKNCLLKRKSFKFWLSPIYQFLLLWIMILVLHLRNFWLIQSHECFLHFLLEEISPCRQFITYLLISNYVWTPCLH